jgi:hypothetical protein
MGAKNKRMEKLASETGGSGWNRTADRRLMSPLLYLLSYATNSKNIP